MNAPLSLRAFDNALRILRGIDLHELEQAGMPNARSIWAVFRDDPVRYFAHRADERGKAALWRIIQDRQPEELRAADEGVLA